MGNPERGVTPNGAVVAILRKVTLSHYSAVKATTKIHSRNAHLGLKIGGPCHKTVKIKLDTFDFYRHYGFRMGRK